MLDEQIAYWKERLGSAARVLDLPTDRPRPPVQSHRGARHGFTLPAEVSSALDRSSRAQGATLFMTLLAAFDVLLLRWSGQTDLVVGTPIAGRTRVETEGLIGFFVNTLALRAQLDEEATFSELVARVKEACLGAYAHQDMPFERLVQELSPERDLSSSPLFQVLFVLQNTPATPLAPPSLKRRGVAGGGVAVESSTAKFDLTLVMFESPRGLVASIEYATDLFDAATIERLAASFTVLLAGAAAHPERRLRELPILPADEERRLLVEWTATSTDYPRDASIHALFEAQAARTPEAIALSFGETVLSYGALNRRANKLAHHLRARGVAPEAPVGLYARRSLEMVIATLAILKAGGAYVPLDPEMPDARLEWTVADAQIALVVAAAASPAGRPLGGASVLDLGAEAAAIEAESAEDPAPTGAGGALAYIMYTSGSTGIPKGVCVVHRGVVRLVKGTDYARLGADEVFLQLAPISFDAATLEIWGPLLNGGRLVVFPAEPPSLSAIGNVVRATGVTTMWATAGLFNALVESGTEGLGQLRQLLFGGEAASVAHVQKARELLPGVQLINGYGPTENTTFTACYPVPVGRLPASIPLGRPIANTVVHVLDRHQQPVPIGVWGELYVGGDGLARGYLARPELTAEKFVQSPFSRDPASRLYRTGDLVRWLADGTLAFLGRLDLQVKLRGYRIELGEIEAALSAHAGVGECAVLLREDVPGDKRLVAYVVPGAAAPSAADLRSHLEERLPAYMVPSAWVMLAALPLTANGKLDRRALPAPEAGVIADGAHVPPRGPIEETLAGIFAEVLRVPVEVVGAHDGFFELGGHSLLATQAIARIRTALGVELPLRALFEAPAPAELAARVDAALREGQELVAPALVRAARQDAAPLSFAQERLWFLNQLDPGDPSYIIPLALRLGGALDAEALGRALAEIVRRHEILRTTYTLVDGHPAAIVREAAGFSLAACSLLGVPDAERDAALAREIAVEARRPFDLAAGPVLRATLFAFAADDHALVLTMHHVASDGWSVGVLNRELTALYEAFSQGRPSPLGELPIQYADYAVWQRGWLSGEVLDRHLAYWKGRLAGASRVLDLPTDRPRPPQPTHRGGVRRFALAAEPTAALRKLARGEGATLFMTLLAAFDVLLWRWSGQADLVVGSPIAGRTRAETESLVGFFVNTLVLRTELADDLTFRGLLARVREDALGAYAHQDTPFERLVQELEPVRDLSRTPLFQVMFTLQNAPMGAARLPGLTRRGVAADSGTAKFDLTLTLADGPSGLMGAMEHATDLFDGETVERMLASFGALLEGLAASADRRLWELAIMPANEEERLLARGAGKASLPATACLHELFEAQVDRTPDAPAATYEAHTLSYRELDDRANRVAHALRRRGVGPGVLVGLCVGRSLDLLVGLIGILKAGGAYLPLDPEYPKDRVSFMIEDSRAPVVLAESRFAELVAAPRAATATLLLDADAASIAAEPARRLSSGALPEDLAYVIYTSGSTGKPKGAMVEHRNVARLFAATDAWYRFEARDVWTMFHSYAFDFSVWEIWGALLVGGRVVIVPYWVSRSPEAFYQLLLDEKVTVLNQTPSAFRQLVRAEDDVDEARRDALALRYVIFGGEALDIGGLRPFWDRHGDHRPQLVNMYGITETTVHVTYRPVGRADLDRPWSSVIGEPIPDLGVYILDARRQLAPVGVPGELYVSGAGVARGYLNRPELTSARFLEDPFHVGGRLYRTGDLARWLANGEVEYLGRIDHQVKLRGFRIELGEIEAALDQHPGVREAVVVTREDVPGDKRLVAYVVLCETRPSAVELRASLKERLPEYMVPSAFVVLEALPLTANGKIDRRALPVPEAEAAATRAYVAPRGPVEETLAAVFAGVLRLPQGRVGAHDGFFELGGHSLLATQAIARIRTALGVELPLRALFEAPTPAELAPRVELALRAGPGPADSPLTRLTRASRDAAPPLSFGQERLWVLDQLDPGDPAYVVPSVIRYRGPLDARALELALGEIVRRHEILRTTYSTVDGRPVQVVHDRVDVVVPVEDLRGLAPAEREGVVRRELAAEARGAFDLRAGPMIRARLLAASDEEHLLLLTMHHIVCDAWSSDVLRRELATLYEAFHQGRPSPLVELPIQYADYAAWQRRWFSGDIEASQLAYWRGQLTGAAQILDLPSDRPRPTVMSHRGAERRFTLPAELAGALRELSRKEGATLFMTLLAAFDVLLYRYTGQGDLSVGMPIANRSRTETEGLIGFFLNTLVLRASLADELSFRALLAQVKETCLGAYAHQDMPFERLVQELAPERDLGRSPLFQVTFTLHAAAPNATSGSAAASSGLQVGGGTTETATAKFDLSLGIAERPDGALAGSLEYSTELFELTTIDRMIQHLATLLTSAARDPDQRLRQLRMLPAEERQLLRAWNDTAAPRPRDLLLHRLVELQVDRTPDAVAVIFEGAALTYRQLDERANRIANHLQRLGVGADSLVGLCMDRGLDLPAAMLGVLKAGAAYVPIDPSYPRERIETMLEDAGAPVLLVQADLAASLPTGRATVVAIDTDGALATASAARPSSTARPDHLAYVIYTSGSTGKPKGVMIPHRAIVNHMLWMHARWPLGASEAVLQKTPMSFDASVWEFWAPLMGGARLVMARPGGHREPGYLVEAVVAHGVTELQLVPSMLELLVLEPGLARWTGLKRLYVGGEALSRALVDRFKAWRDIDVINLYGPTECAVQTVAWVAEDVARGPMEPIGRPIDNVRLYILDRALQPVPVGVAGELYIGGLAVGRGYVGRPDLTAEKFVPDAFGTAPAARLYQTGDLARYLPDGVVDYLGRIDHQVKLRGYRIELGEIDAVLRQHPALREAVVAARQDGGPMRLVAYLVLAQGGAPPPTVGALRAFVQERLPEFMVPSAFVLLPGLPLTPGGKIDRKALPAPEAGDRLELGGDSVAPQTATEEALERIWAGVLRLEKVGIHDNFFEIGGDSILSIQIVARAAQAGLQLTPRQLFQTPTIAALAATVGERTAIDAEQGEVTGPVMATPIQRWWLEQDFTDRHHWNQSFFFEVRDRLDPAILEEVLEKLISHHDALRLRLSDLGELSIAAPGAVVPLLVVDVAGTPDAELRPTIERVAADAQASLPLGAGPLLRAVLFDRGPDASSRLLLVIHHLAVDGVSWRILLDDLWAAYAARIRGEPIALPAKTTSFQRWAERLAIHAKDEAIEAEASYWLSRPRPRGVELPVDHERGENTEETARHVLVSLDEDETEALLRRVPEVYRTQINDVLLTAFAQTLGGWTGAPAAVIDLEGHGREELFQDVDLTRTVGWFTSLFPVIIELGAEAGPGEALKSVKEQLRAIPGRGVGYGLLRYLSARADVAERLAASVPAEVIFNYLGQFDQTASDVRPGDGALQVATPSPRRLARESSGPSHSPQARRAHLLELNASVSGGRLVVQWTYSERRHRRATIEALAHGFLVALRTLIAHCLSPEAGGATPSDFQNTNLSQDAIDMLAALDPNA